MSHKSQMFPLPGARKKPVLLSTGHLWGRLPANLPDVNSQDVKLLRSWPVYDSAIHRGFAPRRISWDTVLGFALATFVSAGIWAGIGLMIARLWK
jgi:hypothetical protein